MIHYLGKARDSLHSQKTVLFKMIFGIKDKETRSSVGLQEFMVTSWFTNGPCL